MTFVYSNNQANAMWTPLWARSFALKTSVLNNGYSKSGRVNPLRVPTVRPFLGLFLASRPAEGKVSYRKTCLVSGIDYPHSGTVLTLPLLTFSVNSGDAKSPMLSKDEMSVRDTSPFYWAGWKLLSCGDKRAR